MNQRALMGLAVLICAAVLGAGCGEPADAVPREDKNAAAPGAKRGPRQLTFDGRVVPTQATELRAPQNSLKLRFWTMSSSWTKLVQLAPEGKEVKKGDVVGRFEFRGDRALPRIMDNINQVKAEKNSAVQTQTKTTDELRTQLRQQEIDALQAELDTRKQGLVSERNMAIFTMAHKQAQFEANATRRQVAVQQRRAASQIQYYEERLGQANAELVRFNDFKKRYEILAPHDGIVRHGYSRRRRRKLQKGDGMPAGYPFASLALDKTVMVEFFVPENQRAKVKVGDKVKVVVPLSGQEVVAVVESLSDFPQEIGFLRENDELPGAREKVYVARARLDEQPDELKAGLELEVIR